MAWRRSRVRSPSAPPLCLFRDVQDRTHCYIRIDKRTYLSYEVTNWGHPFFYFFCKNPIVKVRGIHFHKRCVAI